MFSHKEAFTKSFRYLYTETVEITPDNVLAVLHASKIYLVQGLVNKCLQKLKGKMMTSNLCLIMEAAHVFGENELREMCRTEILRDPKQVLPMESLAELCSDCLALVIKDNNLQMEEEEIFECIVKYSKEKCRKDSLPLTPENKRLVLGKALQEIRFTEMEKEYFVDKVEPLAILTQGESKAVIKYMLNPRKAEQPPFNMALRRLHRIVKRFETHSAGWTYNYRHEPDAIMFECDQDIELHGVLTYGSCDGPKQFDACIKVLEASKPHVIQVYKITSDGHTKYYDCLFSSPVLVQRNTKYTVLLEMKPGRTTFYGENGQELVENAGVKFKFMNSSLSLNNTRISRGQIPGLIFKVENIDV